MKLLLHTCCAPCAIYPIDEAKKDRFTVCGFFYNPNIHPYSEYIRRKKEAETYFKSRRLKLALPEYNAANFFKEISSKQCPACWSIRLDKTITFAKENNFDAFTTTLLGSPYQDHEILKNICENLSREKGIKFYYRDFRTGFKNAHRIAHEKGMYCQNYCGCVFSMVEREEDKRAMSYK